MEQVTEPQPLCEWFAENYKQLGAQLEFVSDRSKTGAEFVQDFGGVGGLLRHKLDVPILRSVAKGEDEA